MKVMCIKGRREGYWRKAIRAGQIYTAVGKVGCCDYQEYIIAELPWNHSKPTIRCHKCGKRSPCPPSGTYGTFRFIPWKPETLGVTEQEVKELYQPTKKEKSDAPVPQRT